MLTLSSKTKATALARVSLAGAVSVLAVSSIAPAFADNVDPLDSGQQTTQQQTTAPNNNDSGNTSYKGNQNNQNNEKFDVDENKSDFQKTVDNYNPTENAADSSGSGVFKFFGFITGWLINLLIVLFFLNVVVDLLYIAIPFFRPFLADANEDGQGNSIPQAGGFGGGGFGGGGFGGGGFGGGMGAGQGDGVTARKRAWFDHQWASDEAIDAVKTKGGAAMAQTNGGGGFGMAPMAQNQENAKGTVLGYYFRKKIVTVFLLGFCLVMLVGTPIISGGMTFGTWLMGVLGSWLNLLPDPSSMQF